MTKREIEELKCATYWPILTSSKSNKSEERLFLVGNGLIYAFVRSFTGHSVKRFNSGFFRAWNFGIQPRTLLNFYNKSQQIISFHGHNFSSAKCLLAIAVFGSISCSTVFTSINTPLEALSLRFGKVAEQIVFCNLWNLEKDLTFYEFTVLSKIIPRKSETSAVYSQ